ncbi:lysylphosphatidylglycerol synthase transmembrane domain-containing protein [Solimonas variicoloris]|uniref:lysylphosphatidylglycerol synthase transmembrane domain-containing protein n=1 Tax=Solimonas variicoloris TaxID=254408 RepID=UPI0004779417|nr:YbhN family protein [Solimonas variicoloris]
MERSSHAAPRMDDHGHRGFAQHPHWRRLGQLLTLVFFALVVGMIATRARTIAWDQVGESLRGMPVSTLLAAAGLALASYAIYAAFDWFARSYLPDTLGARMSRPRQFAIAWVSYAFNLNLGSLIGSVGFRYRLYSRSGVEAQTIARIIALSLVTNWSGYFLLGGTVFALRCVRLPEGWELGTTGLQLLGVGMLALLSAYVALCARWHDRTLSLRGHEFRLPTLRLACAQITLSSLNWLAIATTIWVLLPEHVGFAAVLSVFLLSSVAGAVTHVPGGIGVLEAVFFALLGSRVAEHDLLAALLAFRGVYYIGPLAPGFLLYLWIELRGRRGSARRLRTPRRLSGAGP